MLTNDTKEYLVSFCFTLYYFSMEQKLLEDACSSPRAQSDDQRCLKIVKGENNKKEGGPPCRCDLSGGYVLPPHQKGKLLSADILCNLRASKSCWKVAIVWKFPYGGSVNLSVLAS